MCSNQSSLQSTLQCVWPTKSHTITENTLFFSQKVSHAQTPQVGVGLDAHFLPAVPEFSLCWACNLCFTTSVSSYAQLPFCIFCIQKTVASFKSCTTLTIAVVLPLFSEDPESLGEAGVIRMSSLGLNTPQSLVLYTWTSCGSLCWLAFTARSFSDEDWEVHWSMGRAMSLGVLLLLWAFSKVIAESSLFRPMYSIGTNSWPVNGSRYCRTVEKIWGGLTNTIDPAQVSVLTRQAQYRLAYLLVLSLI